MGGLQREFLEEAFVSVRPYLNFPSELEELIGEISKDSATYDEFVDNFESVITEEKDPVKKADFRIFLNELETK